jgi:hypothetical protein
MIPLIILVDWQSLVYRKGFDQAVKYGDKLTERKIQRDLEYIWHDPKENSDGRL